MEGFHAVVPRTDCPHAMDQSNIDQLLSINIKQTKEKLSKSCGHCDETFENWICLFCGSLECSRYKNGHMKDHNEETGHPFAISLADFSCWCYSCGDYIWSPTIKRVHDTIYLAKFDEAPQAYSDDQIVLHEKISQLSDWIKKSRKVVFFTGNGINTAALIPKDDVDQSKVVEEDNSLFSQQNTRTIELQEMKPTLTHNVIKQICCISNTSHLVITTNQDDLHEQSGLNHNNLHKINVKIGEEIPQNKLLEIVEKIKDTDLYIVVGSSMRISPANKIPDLVKQNGGKLIIINAQNTTFDADSDLRIWSSADNAMRLIANDLNLDI